MSGAAGPAGGPGPAALVVVDMQHIFAAPSSQWYVPSYDAVAAQVSLLVERFEGPVIWTRFVRDPEERGSWSQYYDRWPGCRAEPDSPVWDLTQPIRDEDHVLTLPTFSKWGPELAELTAHSDHLIVAGVATDCCVLATVLGAADAGKKVTIVTDACGGVTTEAHEQAIALMSLLAPMVELVTTAKFAVAPRARQ